jgi:hypothetical protein
MPDGSWNSTGLEILRPEDFSAAHLNRPGRYIVCFGATWCPITLRFMPKFVARRDRLRGTLAIADITDNSSPLWDVFRVRITPSILVFEDGEVASRVDGERIIGISGAALASLDKGLARTGIP